MWPRVSSWCGQKMSLNGDGRAEMRRNWVRRWPPSSKTRDFWPTLFAKNSSNLSKCAIFKWKTTSFQDICHQRKLLNSQNILAGFFKTLPWNGPFASNSFFKVAIIKTKSATVIVFSLLLLSSSSLLLFLLSFFFVSVTFELIRPQKTAFWSLFTQWLQISLGWFSKNRLDISIWVP